MGVDPNHWNIHWEPILLVSRPGIHSNIAGNLLLNGTSEDLHIRENAVCTLSPMVQWKITLKWKETNIGDTPISTSMIMGGRVTANLVEHMDIRSFFYWAWGMSIAMLVNRRAVVGFSFHHQLLKS